MLEKYFKKFNQSIFSLGANNTKFVSLCSFLSKINAKNVFFFLQIAQFCVSHAHKLGKSVPPTSCEYEIKCVATVLDDDPRRVD